MKSSNYNLAFSALFFAAMAITVLFPETAFAQSAANPFGAAANGATQFRRSLQSFALAVGGIGMVACLLLGFFGKLNWKWVGTGVGVSFAIAIVPGAIGWLNGLAGATD